LHIPLKYTSKILLNFRSARLGQPAQGILSVYAGDKILGNARTRGQVMHFSGGCEGLEK